MEVLVPVSLQTRLQRNSRFTWLLVFLLLGSTTINFIDRQALSVLAPVLREEFRLSNSDYARILNAFMIAYTIMYGIGGWVIDRLGVRRGLSLAVVWWSVAASLQATASGPVSLASYRFLLGVGEGANWPAFAKAISLWVPKRMQSLAIGIANSGSSLGTAMAAPLIAWLALRWGWRWAFLVTGTFGFFWVAVWLCATRRLQVGSTNAERTSDRVPWRRLLQYRATWGIFVCRFIADPVWYFYVFWIPEFLKRERGLELGAIGMVAWIPFAVADVANFACGGFSSWLLHRGWSVHTTRKTIMAWSAAVCPLGVCAAFSQSLFWTVFFISVAILAYVFWTVTVHSLPVDFFPSEYVGSVFGFGGTGSSLGTVLATWIVGLSLDRFGSYSIVFVCIGSLLPIAYLLGGLVLGKIQPVEVQ